MAPPVFASNRSGTVSAFAASDGIFSFAIACPSGSAFRFGLPV
jgi:hypothetical protein